MPSNTFSLQVVLPERVAAPVAVVAVDVPAVDGRLTVMAGHQPLICAIQAGICRVTGDGGNASEWRCSDGTLEVESGGSAVLLVSTWERAAVDGLSENVPPGHAPQARE